MSEANKVVARRLVEEVINQGNFAALEELVSTDHTYYEPTRGQIHGRDAYQNLIAMYRNAFPDIKLTIDQIIEEGDTAVTRYTGHGTQRGELMGIPATGREVTVAGVAIYKYRNGKIAEQFHIYDVAGMMTQLGVTKALVQAA